MSMKKNRSIKCMTVVLAVMMGLAAALCACGPSEAPDAPVGERAVLSLPFRGTEIAAGDAVEPLLGALGDDYTMQEAASCAGIGKDYVYTYPSLRLYVFAPEGGEAIVTSVCYTDDGAAIKGVTIGGAADAAVAALGEPDEQTESKLVYRDETSVLTLSLRDGIVTAIVLSEK